MQDRDALLVAMNLDILENYGCWIPKPGCPLYIGDIPVDKALYIHTIPNAETDPILLPCPYTPGCIQPGHRKPL